MVSVITFISSFALVITGFSAIVSSDDQVCPDAFKNYETKCCHGLGEVIKVEREKNEHLKKENTELKKKLDSCNPWPRTDCLVAYNADNSNSYSGEYLLRRDNEARFSLYCDTNRSDDWIVIQRRVNDTVSFNRGWSDYLNGFGNLSGNFWLGLKNIHLLTSSPVDIMFEVTIKDTNEIAQAKYTNFSIDGQEKDYTMHLNVTGTYNNVAMQYKLMYSNGFGVGNNQPFTTFDHHDKVKCAVLFKGGWWYNKGCSAYSLNNPYRALSVYLTGIKKSEIKIRRANK